MLRAAAASRPWMRVEDWELREERQPRSYDTLCHLRSRGETAALLMGSDKLPELEHGWLHVPEIAAEFGIVCLARGGMIPERCSERMLTCASAPVHPVGRHAGGDEGRVLHGGPPARGAHPGGLGAEQGLIRWCRRRY